MDWVEQHKNSVISGDALNRLRAIPDHSIPTVITDPPYNIGDKEKFTKQGGRLMSTLDAWGNKMNDVMTPNEYRVFMTELAIQFKRILTPGGSLLIFHDRSDPCGALQGFHQRFILRNVLMFIKKNPIPHYRKTNYRSGFEVCSWFTVSDDYYLDFTSQEGMVNVFYGAIGSVGLKATDHPTEKYLWMIEPLVIRHAPPESVILDPFFGSGSTGAGAIRNHRDYIGIEQNPEYIEMSEERLGREIRERNAQSLLPL